MKPVYQTGKFINFICFLIFSECAFGQAPFSPVKLDTNKLPFHLTYEGKIKNAVRWTDKTGDNVVITSETGVYRNPKFQHDNDGSDAELFATHYLISHDSARETWKVYDLIRDCPVDLEATLIKKTFQLTDLNKDGMAEIWLMYKTVCHGDVSPCDMKIIMYQGQQKFAMRGQNKVFVGTDEKGKKQYIGGEYKCDPAFTNGPRPFIEFAKKLWNRNIMQTW
jgi:hypothetical protein